MKNNFLKNLISRLSPDVFKPLPEGILYLLLQDIEREIGGECPWDTSDHCYKGFTNYWYFRCRNSQCPGYKHPLGLISYTSESDPTSSINNNFNYASLTTIVSGLYVPLGTLGAQMQFDFGGWADVGGFGAGYFSGLYFGHNSQGTLNTSGIFVGDKWYVSCKAATQLVGTAIADPGNKGSYGPVATKGPYIGDHDTIYTIELIDFWGYVQNFNDAILQMCLATCDGVWLDYWGAYFGIPRLLVPGGSEADNDYKQRIIKEITRAKGTKPVILEEAIRYFKSPAVKIVEYCQVNDWDGPNIGKNPDGSTGDWTNPDGTKTKGTDRAGLQPYQFYIYPPVQLSPSAKFVKDGTTLLDTPIVWSYVGGYGYYGYGYSDFAEWPLSIGNWLFDPPASVGDACVFGNLTKFSGLLFDFGTLGIGGTYAWEYWNGTGWTTLPVSDITSGLTTNGSVWWKLPNDWVLADKNGVTYNIPNTGTAMYWVRVRVISEPSVVPAPDTIQLSYAGATNRGRYIGYTGDEGTDPDAYDPTKRDRNNCYIYTIVDFEKPDWQSGFQEIVDRLKTAGTICIINPH